MTLEFSFVYWESYSVLWNLRLFTFNFATNCVYTASIVRSIHPSECKFVKAFTIMLNQQQKNIQIYSVHFLPHRFRDVYWLIYFAHKILCSRFALINLCIAKYDCDINIHNICEGTETRQFCIVQQSNQIKQAVLLA